MTEHEVRRAIHSQAIDEKVSCRAMLELASAIDMSPKEIGELCNEMKIRISNCQLGCFK